VYHCNQYYIYTESQGRAVTSMLKEPARSFQFCRDYMTVCSFYKYVCGPNTPVSVPVELLLPYLSSWQMFNLEILSYTVWGGLESLGGRCRIKLQGQVVLRCHACMYSVEQNTDCGEGWVSGKMGEKKTCWECKQNGRKSMVSLVSVFFTCDQNTA